MNYKQVIAQLNKKYPGKKVLYKTVTDEEPTEILCEVEPAADHPEYSLAIAVIEKSAPHCHQKTTETYKVIKGKLNLYIDGREYSLKKGDSKVIKPYQVHWAAGRETWIECYSQPGWTLEDHILK